MNISAINFNYQTPSVNLQHSTPSSKQNLGQINCDTVSFSGTAKISKTLADAIKSKNYEKILEELEYSFEKLKSGKLAVLEYGQPEPGKTFAAFGIDEVKLFNAISNFGEAEMKDSAVTKLGNQTFDFINISGSKVTDLGNAKIGTLSLSPEQALTLNFKNAKIESLMISENEKTAEKLGELMSRVKGDVLYFPGDDNVYKLTKEF